MAASGTGGLLGSVEWGTMFFSLFIFMILLLLLRKYALGPLMKVMDERQTQIANDIATAEQNRLDAQKLIADQKAALDQARKDAQQVLDSARVTSEKQAAEIVRSAREEAEQFKKSARDEITREKEQAVEALRSQVASLSVLLATKVIEKEIDQKQQEKLIADYLKEVGNK